MTKYKVMTVEVTFEQGEPTEDADELALDISDYIADRVCGANPDNDEHECKFITIATHWTELDLEE